MYAQGAVQIEGWEAGNGVVGHTQYYVPAANASVRRHLGDRSRQVGRDAPAAARRNCSSNGSRVTIVSPDGKVRRSIEVVKSNV